MLIQKVFGSNQTDFPEILYFIHVYKLDMKY